MARAYLAPALHQLRGELNAANPKRDKRSDGWLGDARHASLVSDHNKDRQTGVVRAFDADKDGINPDHLVRVAINDSRTEYVIWNGSIYSRAYGFRRRVYTGRNKHTNHVHISIRRGKQYEDDRRPWGYFNGQVTPPPPRVAPPFPLPHGYYYGPKKGPDQSVSGYFGRRAGLATWQEKMRSRGWKIAVDGLYGPETEKVIKQFQKEKGLAVDGKIGPQTWAAAWTSPRT